MRPIIVILCLLISNEMMACICGPGEIAFEEEYNGASAIVLGKVTARKTKTYYYEKGDFSWQYYEHTIRVKKAYKGEPARTIKVAVVPSG